MGLAKEGRTARFVGIGRRFSLRIHRGYERLAHEWLKSLTISADCGRCCNLDALFPK